MSFQFNYKFVLQICTMCGAEFSNGLVLDTHWLKHDVQQTSTNSEAFSSTDKLNPFRLRPFQCNVII